MESFLFLLFGACVLNITTDHFGYLYIFRKKSSRQRSQSDLLMWTHFHHIYWSDTVCVAAMVQTSFFLSFSQDQVEDRILHNCRHAAEWVEANKPLFCAKVDLPYELDKNEREAILEPFKFTFHNPDDMWRFRDEIMDNKIIWPIVNVALREFVCERKGLQNI